MKVNLKNPEPSEKTLGIKHVTRKAKIPAKKLKSKMSAVLKTSESLSIPESTEPEVTATVSLTPAITDTPMQDAEPPVATSEPVKLTLAQRKRAKKKRAKALLAELKANRPKKSKEEPRLSSSISLPKAPASTSTLDTDEKKLAAAQSRLAEFYSHTLKIQPVPRPCPLGLLKDLCPLAVSVRIPEKNGARYAFLQFRNQHELSLGEKMLTGKSINGKPIRICVSTSQNRPDKPEWTPPESRQMSDFLWNTLFVAHLPRSTTRPDLGQVFRKATSIKMPTFDDGSCKGTCFLTYKSPINALKAFETRHRTYIRGYPIYVNFALKQAVKAVDSIPDVIMSDLSEAKTKSKTKPSSPAGTDSPQNEFTIERTPAAAIPTNKKRQPSVDSNKSTSEPKIIQKYQMKRLMNKAKSGDASLSALELLLRPPAAKPKHSKKTKRLTKRGKQSKHR